MIKAEQLKMRHCRATLLMISSLYSDISIIRRRTVYISLWQAVFIIAFTEIWYILNQINSFFFPAHTVGRVSDEI